MVYKLIVHTLNYWKISPINVYKSRKIVDNDSISHFNSVVVFAYALIKQLCYDSSSI